MHVPSRFTPLSMPRPALPPEERAARLKAAEQRYANSEKRASWRGSERYRNKLPVDRLGETSLHHRSVDDFDVKFRLDPVRCTGRCFSIACATQISPVLPVHRRALSTLLNTNPTPSMRPFSTPSPLNSPRVFLPISPLRHLYPPSISWTPALLADNHPLNLLQPIRDRQVEPVDHLHCQSSWTTKPT